MSCKGWRTGSLLWRSEIYMIIGIAISVHWRAGVAKYQHHRKGTACFLQATKLREETELVT